MILAGVRLNEAVDRCSITEERKAVAIVGTVANASHQKKRRIPGDERRSNFPSEVEPVKVERRDE